jgi:hypothetical protein
MTDRDVDVGLLKSIKSEYTITYKEVFIIANRIRCVSMPLMTNSLDKIIFNEKKDLLSDDVCGVVILLFYKL